MRKLDSALKFIDKISIAMGKGMCWVLPALIGLITYDVMMRRGFSSPSAWCFDVTYIICGFLFALVMAWTMQTKGHIAIDIVSVGLRPRVKFIMDSVLIPIICIPVLVILIWEGIDSAMINTTLREAATSPAAIPLWELRWSIPVGFGFFTLQLLVEWIRGLIFAIKGKPIEELIGGRTE